MIEALTMIALGFPVPANDPEPGSRADRLAKVTDQIVRHCRTHAPRARYSVDGCAAVALSGAFWESALRYDVHSGARKGPAGEECLFQIHRTSSAVPFDEWRPHPYGTNAGIENTSRCVESGVKILMYHAKRCNLRPPELHKLALLYSEYHLPGDCKTLRGNSYKRAAMALRILRKLRQAQKRTAPREESRPNLSAQHASARGNGVDSDLGTVSPTHASREGDSCPVSTL